MTSRRQLARLEILYGVVLLLAIVLLGCVAQAQGMRNTKKSLGSRPNIVLIVADDQAAESISWMPYLSSRPDWIRFHNAFHNVALCVPSRAALLTGQYSHHTRIEGNGDAERFRDTATLATWLRAAGYRTGLIGKYLNGYPFRRGSYIPPGWDWWQVFSNSDGYYNYTMNENGVNRTYGSSAANYPTDVLAGKARSFLEAQVQKGKQGGTQDKPFFLMVTPNAPHVPITPAPRYQKALANVTMPRTPNFNEADVSDKPRWVRGNRIQDPTKMDNNRRKAYQTLLAVDDLVHTVFDTLQANGLLDNTVVIYMSDNGFSFGEHRLFGKKSGYEESIRNPLLIRYPGQEGRMMDPLVQEMDITATIAELTGAVPTLKPDGRSLVPFLENQLPSEWRSSVLLRYVGDKDVPAFWGVRTHAYKYIELSNGERELYDLGNDPFEPVNQAGNPNYADIRSSLAKELVQLANQ